MTELKDAMPVAYNTPEVRFDCPEERKFTAIAEVKANLAAERAEVNDIDGVRVKPKTAGGWRGRRTRRRCWWCAPRPAARRAWSG